MSQSSSHSHLPIGVAPPEESIRRKLARAQRRFALTRLVALLMALAVVALLYRDAGQLQARHLPAITATHQVQTGLERTAAALRARLIAPEVSNGPVWEDVWRQAVEPPAARLLQPPRDSTAAALTALRETQAEFANLAQVAGGIGAGPLALASALQRLEATLETSRAALERAIQRENVTLGDAVHRLTTIAVTTLGLVILVMIATFFISLRVLKLIHRTVVEPVELLADSAAQLAAGNLREDVPVTSTDELGRLARCINQLRVSLALAEIKYRSLFANTSNSMVLIDAGNFDITDANKSFEELLGASRRQVAGKSLLTLFEEEQRNQLEEGLRQALCQGQHSVTGIIMTTPTRLMAVLDARITSVQVAAEKLIEITFIDVTEQYVKNQALSEIAFKDELTGLYNHRSFYQKLQEEVQQARQEGGVLTLLFVDLDNFKQCNDTFGHQVGDQLLRNVGQLVRDHIRQDRDSGFRYGGDEFAVLLPDAKANVAERIANQVREGFESIEQFGTSMSIGVAELKEGMDGDALVKAADGALYAAKSAGKNTVCISQ